MAVSSTARILINMLTDVQLISSTPPLRIPETTRTMKSRAGALVSLSRPPMAPLNLITAGTSSPMPQRQTVTDAEPGQASDADDTTASASVAHDGVGGTIRPLPSDHLQDPTHSWLPTNDNNLPGGDLHSGTGVQALDAPSIPMRQHALTAPPLISVDWSRAPSNRDVSPPTSGFTYRSMAAPPQSLSVGEAQQMNDWAAAAAPGIANGDAVALVETMLHHGYIFPSQLLELIRIHVAVAQTPVWRALPQSSADLPSLNPTTTLSPRLDIGSSAQMPTDDMDWRRSVPSDSPATTSASNAYLTSDPQDLSSSYLSHHAATPAGLPGPSRAPPTSLIVASTVAAVSHASAPNLYCGPGHDRQLQTFMVVADTNASPSTQGPSNSSASFGPSYSTGHGQYPAVLATAASVLDACGSASSALSYHRSSSVSGSTAHMASERKTSKQDWKSGNCSRCDATRSSQWRRDPETKEQLCNRCGQKAHAAHKKQREREQEHNPCVAGFPWRIRC
jgi:hypothetical protein